MKSTTRPTVPLTHRRGVIVVIAVVTLVAMLTFVALSVDVSYISMTRTRMQNACDSAALAGALEITHAVQNAGPDVEDVTAYAMQQARLKAAEVAALNGVYVDPDEDVIFGTRSRDANGVATVEWGVSPANVVKVVARRTEEDGNEDDGRLRLFFGPVFDADSARVQTKAAAFIESRDIATVLDYSGSMNDDSTYSVWSTRDQTELTSNIDEIWGILDGLRNFGNMVTAPVYFSQTVSGSVSGSAKTGTVSFQGTTAVLSGSTAGINRVRLGFSGTSNTQDFTSSPTNGNYLGSGGTGSSGNTGRVIDEVTLNYTSYGTNQNASGSTTNSGVTRSVTVTFNHPNFTCATTSSSSPIGTTADMTSIRLNYEDGTNFTTTTGFTTAALKRNRTIAGTATKYVTSVTVIFGGRTVTVNNPNGSSKPSADLYFTTSETNIRTFLGVGSVAWPYSGGSWAGYFTDTQTESTLDGPGYRHKYGGRSLVNYLLRDQGSYAACNDLWRTPHYPFHSVKQGAQLLSTFLSDLNFGDELGLVCYGNTALDETSLNYDGYTIDLSSNPISDSFASISSIVSHRQAGHFTPNTNIGEGIRYGKLMLDASKRPGTQPVILVMTDGLANRHSSTGLTSSYSVPAGWDWDELFDFDGDGNADYENTGTSTEANAARYTLVQAKAAVDAGYVVHCMSVGLGADNDLMDAIAWLSRGIHINIPGDQTVAEMEAEVLEGFNRIAAFVPAARLMSPTELEAAE